MAMGTAKASNSNSDSDIPPSSLAEARSLLKRMKPQSPKPKKKKIRTYMRRKTEIEELTIELQKLRQQKECFKYLERLIQQQGALAQCKVTNKIIRDVTLAQRLSFVSSMSMLSQFFRDVDIGPFDVPTRLGKDPAERETALERMRAERLQLARQFMSQKNLEFGSTEFCDQKKFEATNGDLVSTRFEVIPLPESKSVKAIVDAFQTFVYNIEISISEAVGDVTVRENDDSSWGSPVAQHRLITTFTDDVKVEANNVSFSDYRPGIEEEELGIFICDAVDEDELYPYRPHECVRQDLTVVMMITSHQREDGNRVIVLTRFWRLRIRQSQLYTPPCVVERIRRGVEGVGAAMLSTARNADAVHLEQQYQR